MPLRLLDNLTAILGIIALVSPSKLGRRLLLDFGAGFYSQVNIRSLRDMIFTNECCYSRRLLIGRLTDGYTIRLGLTWIDLGRPNG